MLPMLSGGFWLVDHNSYRPPEELRVTVEDISAAWTDEESIFLKVCREHAANEEAAQKEAMEILEFQGKVFGKSGLAENGTFLPKSIHPKYCKCEPKTDYDSAAEECLLTTGGAVEGLLNKTGLGPQDIDILVTTCSIYCPTPSMASMIVNRFKMRSDIQSYHLGGMGCSNGVTAVHLVKDLLKAHPGKNALLVTTEVTTPAFYKGRDKHRLVTNVLFRMGAAAILFSNKPSWVWSGRAKYKLHYGVRVHLAARTEGYKAIWYGPDMDGINGIHLGKNVVPEASKALTIALVKVGPKVLDFWQLLQGAVAVIRKKWLKQKLPPFRPSFGKCLQHFLIHAGGAKVLDSIAENLKLKEDHLEASQAVLFDYGNVSSSTTWYSLGYIESTNGVKKGERVMQIGVGSGIKCGVNVWQALRDIDDIHESWDHRVWYERRQAVAMRGLHLMRHVIMRALFVAVMLLLAAFLYGSIALHVQA